MIMWMAAGISVVNVNQSEKSGRYHTFDLQLKSNLWSNLESRKA